jgi:signal peptidase I
MGAIFSWIIFPVAVVLILHNFVFQAYHVLGTSMVPTLHETDYLIISKLGYTQALVERMFGTKTSNTSPPAVKSSSSATPRTPPKSL